MKLKYFFIKAIYTKSNIYFISKTEPDPGHLRIVAKPVLQWCVIYFFLSLFLPKILRKQVLSLSLSLSLSVICFLLLFFILVFVDKQKQEQNQFLFQILDSRKKNYHKASSLSWTIPSEVKFYIKILLWTYLLEFS